MEWSVITDRVNQICNGANHRTPKHCQRRWNTIYQSLGERIISFIDKEFPGAKPNYRDLAKVDEEMREEGGSSHNYDEQARHRQDQTSAPTGFQGATSPSGENHPFKGDITPQQQSQSFAASAEGGNGSLLALDIDMNQIQLDPESRWRSLLYRNIVTDVVQALTDHNSQASAVVESMLRARDTGLSYLAAKANSRPVFPTSSAADDYKVAHQPQALLPPQPQAYQAGDSE
ncbi:hypothetical protein EV182_008241, partial [Spiromyces aspiralis]